MEVSKEQTDSVSGWVLPEGECIAEGEVILFAARMN